MTPAGYARSLILFVYSSVRVQVRSFEFGNLLKQSVENVSFPKMQPFFVGRVHKRICGFVQPCARSCDAATYPSSRLPASIFFVW
jgi:hypothetical protein